MDLLLLENTSISLREVDEMDPWRKLTFFYFIIEKNKLEQETMENKVKYKGRKIDNFSGSNL